MVSAKHVKIIQQLIAQVELARKSFVLTKNLPKTEFASDVLTIKFSMRLAKHAMNQIAQG